MQLHSLKATAAAAGGSAVCAPAIAAEALRLTNQLAITPDEEGEIRWRDWQARGAASDRRTATRMRRLMVLLVAAFAVWFLVQLA